MKTNFIIMLSFCTILSCESQSQVQDSLSLNVVDSVEIISETDTVSDFFEFDRTGIKQNLKYMHFHSVQMIILKLEKEL